MGGIHIDTLGNQVYKMPEMCYDYKGVLVPPLGMVDYIITMTNVKQTRSMNKMINTFMESKKLGFQKRNVTAYTLKNAMKIAQTCLCMKVK